MHLSYLAESVWPRCRSWHCATHRCAPLELLELRHDARLVPSDGLPALLQAPVQLLLRALHVRALRLAQKRGFLPIGPGGGGGEREEDTGRAIARIDRDRRAGREDDERETAHLLGWKALWSSSSITAVSFA